MRRTFIHIEHRVLEIVEEIQQAADVRCRAIGSKAGRRAVRETAETRGIETARGYAAAANNLGTPADASEAFKHGARMFIREHANNPHTR